jgi:hypothetical protein
MGTSNDVKTYFENDGYVLNIINKKLFHRTGSWQFEILMAKARIQISFWIATVCIAPP